MAKRPQCNRMGASYYIETTYSTAFNNSAITKLFEPDEPVLLDVVHAREDDADVIKGHEFPVDADKNIILAQDVSVPFSMEGSLEAMGWLFSLITGTDTVVATSPNYSHTFKIQDVCSSDQPPSTELILGMAGDTASFWKVKGACLNELKVTLNKAGRLRVSGTFLTDGTLTSASAYTFPTSSSHANPLLHSHADFLTCDTGGSLASKKTVFEGFEFTMNNNLDVADGRANFVDALTYLKSLRFGNRDATLVVTVEGHIGDQYWTDFLANTSKDVQVLFTLSATAFCSIRMKTAKIISIKQGFNGIRDTNEITYKPLYTAGDSSPWLIEVLNAVAAYLVPITAGM